MKEKNLLTKNMLNLLRDNGLMARDFIKQTITGDWRIRNNSKAINIYKMANLQHIRVWA